MNTVGDDRDRVGPEVWERPVMRAALADRDITVVYRLLQKAGFSQQKIARLAGQSQPEVSAIIHGRKVQAYDVLSRIADGLGIPRGYMGLSYTVEPGQGSPAGIAPAGTSPGPARVPASVGARGDSDAAVMGTGRGAASNGVTSGAAESEEDDPVQRRDFLGAAAAVAVGGHTPAVERWFPRPAAPAPPAPARIGAADVEQIRVAANQLMELGRRLGGGAALGAATRYLRWASGLLRARCAEHAGRDLRVALADLYNVTGHSLHDTGRHREAELHFLQGLVLARDIEDHEVAAHLLGAMGRVSLEREHATDALRFFQLAQLSAQDAGSHAETARIHANEAWAYALLDEPKLMAGALDRADREYGRALAAPQPATFHGAAWYLATQSDDPLNYVAATHGILARAAAGNQRSATHHAELTVDASTRLLAADNLPGRLRATRQITLAEALLRARERDTGLAAAHEAVDRVAAIQSVRTTNRLRHLAEATRTWPRHREAAHLRRRIAAL
jgi:tetratricopeptide (TPR) repeat protein/predicted XRE-type DNA-binding protein